MYLSGPCERKRRPQCLGSSEMARCSCTDTGLNDTEPRRKRGTKVCDAAGTGPAFCPGRARDHRNLHGVRDILQTKGLAPPPSLASSTFLACFAQRKPQALQSVLGPRGPFLHSGESVLPHVTQTRCEADGTCFLVFFLAGSSCSPSWKPAASRFRVTELGFVTVGSVRLEPLVAVGRRMAGVVPGGMT